MILNLDKTDPTLVLEKDGKRRIIRSYDLQIECILKSGEKTNLVRYANTQTKKVQYIITKENSFMKGDVIWENCQNIKIYLIEDAKNNKKLIADTDNPSIEAELFSNAEFLSNSNIEEDAREFYLIKEENAPQEP